MLIGGVRVNDRFQDESVNNAHEGHCATCLCCVFLTANMGMPGYGEMTPSSPPVINCDKRVFKLKQGDWDIWQILHDAAKHCTLFEGRPHTSKNQEA